MQLCTGLLFSVLAARTDRVDALRDKLSGFGVRMSRVGETDLGVRPKCMESLDAAQSKLVPPQLGAVGLHQEEKAACVGQLVGALSRLRGLDLERRQHWGYGQNGTPNHTPS